MPRSTVEIIRHAAALADLVESDDVPVDRASSEVAAAYKELIAAAIERGRAEEGVRRAVTKLRDAGGSWNLIGSALGVSRQSAREKYVAVEDVNDRKPAGADRYPTVDSEPLVEQP